MRTVIFRCDDINFFTRAEQLKKIYGTLLEQGIPLSFAVIPRVDPYGRLPSDSPFRSREGLTFEPFLDPQGDEQEYDTAITSNEDLVDLASDARAEILQHGFAHCSTGTDREFGTEDPALIGSKLEAGWSILQKAFSRRPSGFVAPHDVLSKQATLEIARRFPILSVYRLGFRNFPLLAYPRMLARRRMGMAWIALGSCTIVEHPGLAFSRLISLAAVDSRIENLLRSAMDPLVVVSHYWEFFSPSGNIQEPLYERWTKTVDVLLSMPDVRFSNFSSFRASRTTA